MLSMRKLRVVSMGSTSTDKRTFPIARVREHRCKLEYVKADGKVMVWDDVFSLEEALAEAEILKNYLGLQSLSEHQYIIIRGVIVEKTVEIVHLGAGLDAPMYCHSEDILESDEVLYDNVLFDSSINAETNDMCIAYFKRIYLDGSKDPLTINEEALKIIDETYFPVPFEQAAA